MPADPFLIAQGSDGVVGAAKLEGTGTLEVFALQENAGAGATVKLGVGDERRDDRLAAKSHRGLLDGAERQAAPRSGGVTGVMESHGCRDQWS